MRRKVISSERTLMRWSNMFSAYLECGHSVTLQAIKGECPKSATCAHCKIRKEQVKP